MRTVDIAWAAGLFEGEGCISHSRHGTPTVSLCMTDEDVVKRFAKVVGFGSLRGPEYPSGNLGQRSRFWWHGNGYQQAQATIALFWGWLGERRRQKAVEILMEAQNGRIGNAGRKHISETRTHCDKGHEMTPENVYRHRRGTKGCRRCRKDYMSQYYRENKEKWR